MNGRLVALTSVLIITACGLCLADGAGAYPKRKPGLWELIRRPTNPRYPPQIQQICLDAETDALLYQVGENAGRHACSKLEVHGLAGKVIVDSVCRFGNSQLTSHDIISFSGDTTYHEDIEIHYDPPLLVKPPRRARHGTGAG